MIIMLKRFYQKGMSSNSLDNVFGNCVYPYYLQLVLIYFLFLFTLSAQASPLSSSAPFLTKADQLRMLTITQAQLPDAIKTRNWLISDLSVVAIRNGKLEPIPFQIDEINQEGFPYSSQMAIANSGRPGFWDGRDELLFMLQDASTQRWQTDVSLTKPTPISPLLELQVITASGPRYVYLLWRDSRRSSQDYVRYDVDTFFAETQHYALASSFKNPLELTDMQFFAFEDKNKSSLLDTLKMRIQGHWVGANNGLTITNRNFDAKVQTVLQGPIRVSVQMKATILLAKVPIMNLWVMYQFSAAHMRAITRAKTPSWMPMFVNSTSVSISVDANQLRGSKVYGMQGDQVLAVVDGRLSVPEQALQQQSLNPEHFWWLLKSPENFQALATLAIPQSADTQVNLIYQDDARLKVDPERFTGQWPNIGFAVSNIPLDKVYTMMFDLYVDQSKPDYDIPAYIQSIRTPLTLVVTPLLLGNVPKVFE